MKNKYLSLFFTMMKIGLFTFGGGYAMLPLLEHEFVERRHFMEKEEFLDMVAIAESTPGPIAINSATYIGYKEGRTLGAALATVGVCLPSFAILFAISLFFDAFLALAPVAWAFRGIQVAVIYLIMSAGIKMMRALPRRPMPILLFALTLCAFVCFSLFALSFSAVFYILIGGAVGVFAFLMSRVRKGGKSE